MKLDFPYANDGFYHQYCIDCKSETINRLYREGLTFYHCRTCGIENERSIVIDPVVKWWLDTDLEYWHESAGVFVRNKQWEYLFFKRTIFPFSLTVPSGHVDVGESPFESAKRELEEEIGLRTDSLVYIGTEDIKGDSCRRGADAHRWSAYLAHYEHTPKIKILEEGNSPVWLSYENAIGQDLTYPVKYMLKQYERNFVRI